jgi:hypothetical protein
MKQRTLTVTAVLLSLLLVRGTAARQVEQWTYERLFKEADLVVIASAEATSPAEDRVADGRWANALVGQATTFAVDTVLNGKMAGASLIVLHFKLAEGVTTDGGPRPVSFRTKGAVVKGRGFDANLGKSQYLLFLKSVDRGRFAPLSGQIDPTPSVREVYSPLPAEIDDK